MNGDDWLSQEEIEALDNRSPAVIVWGCGTLILMLVILTIILMWMCE